jgi:hypothetical protein
VDGRGSTCTACNTKRSSSFEGVALHFGIRLLFQSHDLWDLLLIYSVNEFSKD